MFLKNCSIHGDLVREELVRDGENYRCKKCTKIKNDRYREIHKDRLRKAACEYQRKNKDRINLKVKEDRKKNPQKYREYEKKLREKYGDKSVIQDICSYLKITLEQYNDLIKKSDSLCAICNKAETRRSRTAGKICRIGIDHCHDCEDKKGMGFHTIRGVLCHSCNTLVGKAHDNPEILRRAALYLEEHCCVE